MKPHVIALASLIALAGCAGAQTTAQSAKSVHQSDHGDGYAAALAEAFSVYEQKVRAAESLTYASDAEVSAVMLTLSEQHFDWQLTQALERRGLDAHGLAQHAAAHPEFFRTQELVYAGRLERLQRAVAALPQNVARAPEQDVVLAADMHE